MSDVRSFARTDDRALRELRALAPKFPTRRRRLRRSDRFAGCCYCGKATKRQRRMVTNPISFRREYLIVCHRSVCIESLRRWEGGADARRKRAQFDWERENPTIAAAALVGHLLPQYPSFSRATLRAFIDSAADAVTVEPEQGVSVQGLNSSIRSLGFGDEVYAEQRSNGVAIRRIPR